MSRIKSKKYNGVYLNHLTNKDTSYSITYKDVSNKLVRFTVGKKSQGITEIYAYNKRTEFINQVRLGEDPLSKKKRQATISLEDLTKIYFDDKRCMQCDHCQAYTLLSEKEKLKNTTLICSDRKVKHLYNKYNKHIEPKFGKENIASIKTDNIRKLVQSLKAQHKANNTINGIIQLFSAIINYSIKNKELKVINPCIGISKLSIDNERDRYLTTAEVQQLFKHVKDERALLFLKLALSTGGRLQTILNIRKKDLNLSHHSISLKDIKNNDTYYGFINDELTHILEQHTKALKADDYIIGSKSTPLSANAISITIRPVLNKLFNGGLKKDDSKNRVVIHSLRHTFASHLAINGTPIFTIQKLMNHKDIKMTMRYAKLAPDSGMDQVKSLYTLKA